MRPLAVLAVASVVIVAACSSSTPPKADTPSPSPVASEVSSGEDASSYLADATRLIGLVKSANASMLDLLNVPNPGDSDWALKASTYPLSYGIYSEQWRDLQPPASYGARHDAVQRSLDKLDAAGNLVRAGDYNVARGDFAQAAVLFDSAADKLTGP